MADDFFYDWTVKVREIWRGVIGEADPFDGIAKAEAKAQAAELIHQLVDAGELKVPIASAINAAIDRADDHDGGMADKVISRMMKGEEAFDLDDDPALDLVVVLGDGLRKTLGNVTRSDLDAMDTLRYRNTRAAADAYDRWRETYDRARLQVEHHGTFGAAVEAGAFQ